VGDYDFWLRLSMKGLLSHRQESVAQWRSHSLSTSIAERGASMAQERIDVIDEFVAANSKSLNRCSISSARAHSHYLAARLGFFSREVDSRKLFIRALKLNPRVILSVKPHEFIFMLTFPLSKKMIDAFLRLRE
jgi:hypothetical protein